MKKDGRHTAGRLSSWRDEQRDEPSTGAAVQASLVVRSVATEEHGLAKEDRRA
jgi:hypothetical protein